MGKGIPVHRGLGWRKVPSSTVLSVFATICRLMLAFPKLGWQARPLTKTDRFPAVALFSGFKWNNDGSPAWVILGQSFFFCFAVFCPPPPVPILPPPQVTTRAVRRAVCCRFSAFLFWEVAGGIIFITLCTKASRANGKRQSNLLLQGISWLPAGSGRNFALPPLLGSEAAQHQHSLSLTPKNSLVLTTLLGFFCHVAYL